MQITGIVGNLGGIRVLAWMSANGGSDHGVQRFAVQFDHPAMKIQENDAIESLKNPKTGAEHPCILNLSSNRF